MTRQQRRQQERLQAAIRAKGESFRKTNPMAEEVHRQGYEEGWKAACDFCMRTCYAAAALALHDMEGYGHRRNTRFLRKMDGYVTNTLSSGEIIEEALEKAGVQINFRAPFEEERVVERE